MTHRKVPSAPSIRRLPTYLPIARRALHRGDPCISGAAIAQELNMEPIQVRKDLALTGITGTPNRGYPVPALIEAITQFLGWDAPQKAVLVGAGNLGSALLGYPELLSHGLHVVAAFDNSPIKIGSRIHNVPVFALDALAGQVRTFDVGIGILTVPPEDAQAAAETLAAAGIRGIWNFSPVQLDLPGHITVEQEDLSAGYALLCATMREGA